MAAYLVAHVLTHDPSWLESEYIDVFEQLLAKYDGTRLARGLHEQVEGAPLGPATVVIRFPDLESAHGFWNDPEYTRVAPIRRAAAEAQVILLEGLPTSQ